MNVFERIKERCVFEPKIGRTSLEAFLKILKDVEKEHGGDWIPCSEQPLKEDSYIVAWIPENLEVRCDRPHYYGIFDYENGDWNIDVPDSFKNIGIIMLAYRPLPEPYQPKFEFKCANPASPELIAEVHDKLRKIEPYKAESEE